jgi:Phospholipase_D-nuclease N-terminal
MIIAADYPFMDVLGTMLVFFFWVMWFWCLIVVLTDVFSRSDIGGWAKAGWTVLTLLLPLLGVLIYLVAEGRNMAERRASDVKRQETQLDDRIRRVSTTGTGDGAATQIAHAKELLDAGTIDAQEFEQLKRKALA